MKSDHSSKNEQKLPPSDKPETPQVDATIQYSCSKKANLVFKAVLGAGTGVGLAYKLAMSPIAFGISAACGGLASLGYRVTTTFDEYKRKATSKISRKRHADILQESSEITADSIKLVIDGKANVKEQLKRLSSPEDQAKIIAKVSHMRDVHREKAKKDRNAAHDRRVARGEVSEKEEKLRVKMEQDELAKVETELLEQCQEEQKSWQANKDEIDRQIEAEILDPELQPLQPKKATEVKQQNQSLPAKLKRLLIEQLIEEYESYRTFFSKLSKTEKAKVIVSGVIPGVSDWLAASALVAAIGTGYGGVAIALGALSGYAGLRSKTKEIDEIHQDEKEEQEFRNLLIAELAKTKKLNQDLRKTEDVHKTINQKFGKPITEHKSALNGDSVTNASSSHAQMMSSFSNSSQPLVGIMVDTLQPQTRPRGNSSASGSGVSVAPTVSLSQPSLPLPGMPDEVVAAEPTPVTVSAKKPAANASRFHGAARGAHSGRGASKAGHGTRLKQNPQN